MILITGASSGIGRACAEGFAREKKNLFLVARRRDRLEALAQEMRSQHGVEVVTSVLDVSDEKQVLALAQSHARELERVEVLINNAGLARGMDTLQEGAIADWNEMIDTNIKGLLWFTKLVLPFFMKRNSGQVVMMGSVAARWMYSKGNVYSATKAAVHALAESLRLDLLGTRIRVTTIAPGMVETEFSEVRFKGDASRAKTVYEGMQPLSAEDVADAVLWAANRPAHVNIQEIVMYPVDQASTSQVSRKSR
jgi:3-hydroxy acid dehydrogenase/malonic semialdehyde reductase